MHKGLPLVLLTRPAPAVRHMRIRHHAAAMLLMRLQWRLI